MSIGGAAIEGFCVTFGAFRCCSVAHEFFSLSLPDCLAAQLYFAPVSRVSPRVAQAAGHKPASFSDMARHSRERKFRPGADCYRTSGLVATSVRISQFAGPARE